MFRLFMQKEDRGGQKAKSPRLLPKGNRAAFICLVLKSHLWFWAFVFVFTLFILKQSRFKLLKRLSFSPPPAYTHFRQLFRRSREIQPIVAFLSITAGLYQSLLALLWLPLPWPGSPATQLSRSGGGCLRDAPCWADVSS